MSYNNVYNKISYLKLQLKLKEIARINLEYSNISEELDYITARSSDELGEFTYDDTAYLKYQIDELIKQQSDIKEIIRTSVKLTKNKSYNCDIKQETQIKKLTIKLLTHHKYVISK